MNILYKCCFCEKQYDWYDGIYENPNYDSEEATKARRNGTEYSEDHGTFIAANSIILKQVAPVDDRINGTPLTAISPACFDIYINICEDCMRKILDNLHIYDGTAWD